MKIVFLILLLNVPAYAAEYFSELRIGISDGYNKVVKHNLNGTLSGTFTGPNFGIRGGINTGSLQYFAEYNPSQDVEITSFNELAKVSSVIIGANYKFENSFYSGGFIAHSQFELVRGPNGVTFSDNPTTKGLTGGVQAGYKYALNNDFYINAEFMYALIAHKNDGPSTTQVESIEVKNNYKFNALFGYNF